jgi:GntR family transcriptional repressor for pyruvate dehydrogenase complex
MTGAPRDNKKLYRHILDSVSADISAGRLGLGQKLPSERELADKFQVSRPTVREAMLALEIRGLVEARHGSGVYVTQALPTEARNPGPNVSAFELLEARSLVEGEAAALAAATLSDADLASLDEILLQMERENETQTGDEYADRNFHLKIAESSRNPALLSAVEHLWELRHASPLVEHTLDRARRNGLKPRINEHRSILAALRARDPESARKAMRAHLSRVVDDLLMATEIEAVERVRVETAAKREEYARRRAV